MIPVNETPWEPGRWQQALKSAFRSSSALLAAVGTQHPQSSEPGSGATIDFPVLVPRGFADRMRPGDPDDPLLRQVLAVPAEAEQVSGFTADPLLETVETAPAFSTVPGLIQKYHGRVLLITTAGCAIHCRYCFRRHFPYDAHQDRQLAEALTAIAADESITEVILSGGDPLILDDNALAALVSNISNIQHVQRLRIHSRLPVVLPERITTALLHTLHSTRLQVTLVAHSNHKQELNAATARAFACLKGADVWLFNQAVLLRGVNADASTQIELAEALFRQQVLPYYLHLPDRVAGTHHFYIDPPEGLRIYEEMQAHLPGYLLPRLVQEVPKKASKMIVSSH